MTVTRIVRPATVSDREAVLDVLEGAFVSEPAFAHFFGDQYRPHARTFLGFLFDLRLGGGIIWVEEADGRVVAASLWDPPGGPRLALDDQARLWRATADDVGPVIEHRLDAYDARVHDLAPRGNHYYLGVIASHPDARGNGHGRAVLRPGLDAADREGVTTFLETGTEANLAFYARFGFAVTAELTLDDGTRIWCLTRPPGAGLG